MDEGSGSLADLLISLAGDIDEPLRLLISAVCYLLALGLFAQGCFRLLRASERVQGVSGMGTALCFVVSVVLVTLPSWIVAGEMTMFGERTGGVEATLGYSGGGEGVDAMNRLLKAVFIIVGLVGLIAFVRGLFVLRAAADGRPGATAGGAAVMMFGGLLAWHIVPVIGALQSSLGIKVLDIS